MSIVGTRPPTLDEWNKYELHHRARLLRNLGCATFGDIGFWTVFAAFCSWHRDNLFPF